MIFRIGGFQLSSPERIHGILSKGVIILTYPDIVCKIIPDIRSYYVILERRGWSGINDNATANIKLVEDWSTVRITHRLFPKAILLNAAGADFVDTKIFRPLASEKKYLAIHVANWSPFKRHILFISAASLIPHERFAMVGYFVNGGTQKEMEYKRDIIARCKGANIDMLFEDLGVDTKTRFDSNVVNQIINLARIGVITSADEGRNRFKTECLAADIPVVVPRDASYPVKQFICRETGGTYTPTAEGLACVIGQVAKTIWRFSPREYLLSVTGIEKSMQKIHDALEQIEVNDGVAINKNIRYWNGRYERYIWGKSLLCEIKRSIKDAM